MLDEHAENVVTNLLTIVLSGQLPQQPIYDRGARKQTQ